MLRSVYPKVLDGFDVEVRSYLEVLGEQELRIERPRLRAPVGRRGRVHDSCVFARYEGMVDEPRELLAAAGLTVREPEHAGRQTWCCGGPVESLYPAKAAANAAKRVERAQRRRRPTP